MHYEGFESGVVIVVEKRTDPIGRSRRSVVVFAAVLVAALLQTSLAAGAAPPADGEMHYGGHGYELVDAALYEYWEDANAAAVAMPTNEGICAHLATIKSPPEQAILTALMEGSDRNAWIGGYQPPGELSLDQGWQWVTGEPWTYTNWAGGEPNDTPFGTYIAGSEQYLEAYQGSGLWNDAPSPDPGEGTKYFVVEYERCRRHPVEIVVDETLPVTIPELIGQPFAATGLAVDSGVICPAGLVFDTVNEAQPGPGYIKLKVEKRFECGNATGTFEIEMRVRLYPSGDTTAKWKITDGTGNYTMLRGNGTLVGTPFTGGITDVYTGMVKR